MKFITFALLIFNVYTIKLKSQSSLNTEYYWITPEYIDPVYYSCTPIYYSYYSSPIYFLNQEPPKPETTYIFYRKGENKENLKSPLQKKSIDELKKELSDLKKFIWGDPQFDTSKLRKESKIYDAKWLLAQMKITRVAELEDILSTEKKNGSNITIKPEGRINTNYDHPIPNYKEALKK